MKEDIQLQQERIKQLDIRHEDLVNQKIQLQEAFKRQSEKRMVLALEEEERISHHQSLKKLYDKESVNSKGGVVQNDKTESNDDDKRNQLQVENKVFEKLNFHMDKYLTYVELNIRQSMKRNDFEDDKNSYIPTPITAIVVNCLKTNMGGQESHQSSSNNDEESYVNTFKVTKKHTFLFLKKAAVIYWRLLNKDEFKQISQADKEGKGDTVDEKVNISMSHMSLNSLPFKQFELLDELGAVILDTETIDKYVATRLAKTTQESLLLTVTLRRKKISKRKEQRLAQNKEETNRQTELSKKSIYEESKAGTIHERQQEEDEEDDDDGDDVNFIDDKTRAKMQIPVYEAYVRLFKKLPLIRKYFIIDEEEVVQKGTDELNQVKHKKKGLVLDDHHFCMVFVLCFMILQNAVTFMLLDNSPVFLSHVTQLQKLLYLQPSAVAGTNQVWSTISTINQLACLVNYFRMIACSDKIMKQLVHLGTAHAIIVKRIRQLRSKYIPCPHPTRTDVLTEVACIYEVYNPTTQFTQMVAEGQQSYELFTPIESLSISRKSYGLFSSYDASGYIFDVSKIDTNFKFYKDNVIDKMLGGGQYFSVNTLAQVFTLNLRSLNDGTFIFIELLLEYTSTGVFPLVPILIPFSPNLYGTHSSQPMSAFAYTQSEPPKAPSEFGVGTILYTLDILRTLSGMAFMFMVLVCIKNNGAEGQGFNKRYFISLTFLMNVFVLLTTFYTLKTTSLQVGKYETNALQELQEFVDLGDSADLYKTVLVCTAISTCVLVIRLTFMLTFSKGFEAVIYAIEHSYLQISAALVVLSLVLLGFTFVSVSIWGYYLINFSSTFDALLTLLLLAMGQFDSTVTLERGLVLALPFLAGYFFFIYQYMFGIIAIIYIDAYRVTIIDRGIDGGTQEKWSWDEIRQYFVNWIPQRSADKDDKKDKDKDEKASEEKYKTIDKKD